MSPNWHKSFVFYSSYFYLLLKYIILSKDTFIFAFIPPFAPCSFVQQTNIAVVIWSYKTSNESSFCDSNVFDSADIIPSLSDIAFSAAVGMAMVGLAAMVMASLEALGPEAAQMARARAARLAQHTLLICPVAANHHRRWWHRGRRAGWWHWRNRRREQGQCSR